MPYNTISSCRISGSRHLVQVLDLGMQELTGVFPTTPSEPVTSGPLQLVWCPDSGLLQLRHSFAPEEMYGDNYGYRSGLNRSMVEHLQAKASNLASAVGLRPGDIVLDIGSNDGTTLAGYRRDDIIRIGIDPTAEKFREFYPPTVRLATDFFSKDRFLELSGRGKARLITSIAMFYDLEEPDRFVADVKDVLAPDGLWHFEQSYMPTMLRMNSYDTICHEHLEYYSLGAIVPLLERHGLRVVSVQMNSVNGGSFAVSAAHRDGPHVSDTPVINWLLQQERNAGLHTSRPYRRFEERVFEHRNELRSLIEALRNAGKRVFGYGASTKGNVLLQLCGLTADMIPAIAEVNPYKFGRYTPGTRIPILSEEEVHAMRPDYLLVLPWHFRESIFAREKAFLARGGKLIFPLPAIEIV